MSTDPSPVELAEPCGAWPPYLDGHNYPCAEPLGHDGQHRHDGLRWSGPTPPPARPMSTDFPGQPFGRGDTITIIPAEPVEATSADDVPDVPSIRYRHAADVYATYWAEAADEAGMRLDGEPYALAKDPGFRAAVDWQRDAARAPLLAEVADLNRHIGELRAKLIAQAKRFRADLDSLEATQAATDRRLLEAEAERGQARASLAGAVAANDALAGENAELLAEVERLRVQLAARYEPVVGPLGHELYLSPSNIPVALVDLPVPEGSRRLYVAPAVGREATGG